MWASDKGLRRPTDLAVSRGNPSKAIERLGWVAIGISSVYVFDMLGSTIVNLHHINRIPHLQI
jgi:hypothetical protein